VIWSRDVFVVPLGGGCYRVGATYSWDVSDAEVTTEGKNLLLKRLRTLTDSPVVVMDHRAGSGPFCAISGRCWDVIPKNPGYGYATDWVRGGEPWLPR
jgi:hypothetical protein